MTAIDWTPLRSALSACRAAGITTRVWWRDDDATAPTPGLDKLAALAAEMQMQVHLAIIPQGATGALASYCATAPMIPVVHGWAHADHSTAAEKKNEFQTPRVDGVDETAQAMWRMRTLFGTALAPMFVPPWNRINDTVIKGLPGRGYRVLSTFGPRAHTNAAPGLRQINTHVDPIWWKGTRDLTDPDVLVAQCAAELGARAQGQADADEPYGLLTHHLVHTSAIWSFARAFLTEMQMGGAVPWAMENDDEQT